MGQISEIYTGDTSSSKSLNNFKIRQEGKMQVLAIVAVYGALDEEGVVCANDVTKDIQTLLNQGATKIVIDDNIFSQGDPAKGHTKHFGMIYSVLDDTSGKYQQIAVACQQHQTIPIQRALS